MNDQGKFPPLPRCIADEFKWLSMDLSLVSAHWILYRQLFAHSEKRFNLLTRAAPAFFEFLFHTLRDEVFMSLCRLGCWGQTFILWISSSHERVSGKSMNAYR